ACRGLGATAACRQDPAVGPPFERAPLPVHRCAHGSPGRGVDDRQLGGLSPNPVALGTLKAAALPAFVVLDPLAAVPDLLTLVERVREDHARGRERPRGAPALGTSRPRRGHMLAVQAMSNRAEPVAAQVKLEDS